MGVLMLAAMAFLWAPAASSAAPSAVAAATDDGSKPKLLNLGEVFSTDNYPSAAIREKREGTTTVTIDVSATGKPTACVVKKSSGSPDLDTATCKQIMERAAFEPARESGKAVAVRMDFATRWVLPSFRESVLRLVFGIGKGNLLGSCRAEASYAVDTASECARWRSGAELLVAFDKADRSGRDLVVEAGSLNGGGADTLPTGRNAGETLLKRFAAEMTFDAQGRVTRCRMAQAQDASEERALEACERIALGTMVRDKTIVKYSVVFLRDRSAP